MTPVSRGKGAGSQCVGNAVPRRSLRRVWGSTKHRFEPQRPRTGVEGQSACGGTKGNASALLLLGELAAGDRRPTVLAGAQRGAVVSL